MQLKLGGPSKSPIFAYFVMVTGADVDGRWCAVMMGSSLLWVVLYEEKKKDNSYKRYIMVHNLFQTINLGIKTKNKTKSKI